MVITLELAPESWATIAAHCASAESLERHLARCLQTAVFAGAEHVREQLVRGGTVLSMRNTASGLAPSVMGWPISDSPPLMALGIPANSPAAVYAGALERGSTIYPKTAKLLAVPLTPEARASAGPRSMAGLTLIHPKGRPPLLVRMMTELRRGEWAGTRRVGKKRSWGLVMVPQWLLVPSVSLRRYAGWFTRAADEAKPTMLAAFLSRLAEWMASWKK